MTVRGSVQADEPVCDRKGCTAPITGYDAWGQWCDEHSASEPAPVQAGTVREIQARVNAATDGPWNPWAGAGWPDSLVTAFGLDVPENERGVWWPLAQAGTGTGDSAPWLVFAREPADQQFIANARTDIPWLLDRVRELEDALERIAEHPVVSNGPNPCAWECTDELTQIARAALAVSPVAAGEEEA